MSAYVNRIGTAVPPHDVHEKFVEFAPSLLPDPGRRKLFQRMADRAQIEHRFSVVDPDPDPARLARDGFYAVGAFPDTAARMERFERAAPDLAAAALDHAGFTQWKDDVTHLILVSCTGLYAPGLDLQLIERFGLDPGIERTVVGFMGCYAAINALKLARHIVRSDPHARVLILSIELCTLHLQETDDLEQVLSFLIFADGCAAALVSAEPTGLEIAGFHTAIVPDSAEHITWRIGRSGFDMVLSGAVPGTVGRGLPAALPGMLGNRPADAIDLWAVHPGGRTVLDAVERALGLPPEALATSRDVLRRYGNMSSATVLFVLRDILATAPPGLDGCAVSFGPGLTAESMTFRTAAVG